jgi:hypothetical protein
MEKILIIFYPLVCQEIKEVHIKSAVRLFKLDFQSSNIIFDNLYIFKKLDYQEKRLTYDNC